MMDNNKRSIARGKCLKIIAVSVVFLFLAGFCPGYDSFMLQRVEAAADTNITQGKTATASSYMLPFGPERAVDGSDQIQSRWVCANMNGVNEQTLSIDLGAYYTCNRWIVKGVGDVWFYNYSDSGDYNLGSYSLMKSLTYGIPFVPVTDGNGDTDQSVSRFTARYVQLKINSGTNINNKYAAVREFAVYGFPTALPAISNIEQVTFIDANTVSIQTTVIDDGGDNITDKGIVYSESANPTIGAEGSTKVPAGTGPDSFTNSLSGLNSTTTYYARAYATNIMGTKYGSDISFNISKGANTVLTGDQAAPVNGQSIKYTAVVSAAIPEVNTGTPSGDVIFKDGDTVLGTAQLTGGTAEFTTTTLMVGSHSIKAVYMGDDYFDTRTSQILTQNVNKALTGASVESSSNPSIFGQLVSYAATVSSVAPGSGEPTGTVTFKDGTTTLGTAVLNSGTATFTTAAGSVGAHAITVIYDGDGNFSGSTSGIVNQTINKSGTDATVESSSNPSVFGQIVTYTATINAAAPGAGTPTGTVTFYDGSTSLGTVPLSGQTASFSTPAMSLGDHNITVSYDGNGNFNGSTSAVLLQQVSKAETANTVVSTPNPSVTGETVTYTATVSVSAPGSGTPTGTVNFLDGAELIGSVSLSGNIASLTTDMDTVGTHNITAVYLGDTNFDGSTSTALTHSISKADTNTTVISSLNPSIFGQAVTYTAMVSVSAPGSGIPGGTVTFTAGGENLGTAALVGGVATVVDSGLNAGDHEIKAAYSGDSSFNVSTSSVVTQTIGQASTTTTVMNSPNPSVFGQTVTYTANVNAAAPGIGVPTGTVTFSDEVGTLATVTLNGGEATYEASAAAIGIHGISAIYSGDSNFLPSTASSTQTVVKAATITSLSSSLNPSAFGQAVIYTAEVSAAAPGNGTPEGTVTFRQGADLLATVTLSGGSANYTITPPGVGNISITAEYSGDTSFNPSTSAILNQTVVQTGTITTVTSSPNPSVYGQSVAFTATVSAAAPGSGIPTGTVLFKAGEVNLGTAALTGGTAQLTTSALAAGSNEITALYSGASNFAASTSVVLTHNVNKADVALNLTGAPNPADAGEVIEFELNLNPVAPGSGVPTGTVTFKDGSEVLGTAALTGGAAVLSHPGLTAGTHSITVEYPGDVNFESNISSTLVQLVNMTDTSVILLSSQNPSVFGQPVTYTAKVGSSASGLILPTGTVTFKDGADVIGNAALSGEEASITVSSAATGSHIIIAEYSGDGNYVSNISAGLTQTVNHAETEISLASSLNPSKFGQTITLTAEVSAVAPGAGIPAGSVTFMDGATTLGTVPLSGGEAGFSTAALGRGMHNITVQYSGNENFEGRISSQYIQSVDPAAADKVAADKAALEIHYAAGDSGTSVKQDLGFTAIGPVYGSTIFWSSDDTAVISNTGIVNRPLFASGDADVTVTAAVYNDGESDTKDFHLTVLELEQITYTVTFKDWDGGTLAIRTVAQGAAAAAPDNPSRPGYAFTGWDKSFANVTEDLIVTAQYAILPPALTDSDRVEADKAVLEIGFAIGDSAFSVTQNLNLTVTGAVYGSDINWSSSNIAIISNDGIVSRPSYQSGNALVTMTAVIDSNGVSDTKIFSLRVLRLPKSEDVSDNEDDDSENENDNSDTGNDNGNKGSSPINIIVTTTDGNPEADAGKTTTATIASEANTDANGSAAATFTTGQLSDAVKMAVDEAAHQEGDAYTVVQIVVTSDKGIRGIETSIPEAAVITMLQSNIDALTLTTPIGSMTFDRGTLATIMGEADGDIKINISQADTAVLSEETRQIVGDRPVYDFSITSGNKSISQFNGYVSVAVPYTPKPGEDINAIVIYYINSEGKAEIVSNCVYDPGTGTVSFNTGHFSRFTIGYNKVTFGDVDSGAWYGEAVTFAAARGITAGAGNGNFSPGDKLTRGQFLVMTMRTYGISPDYFPESNFDDAGSTYYTGYLAAAKRLGISKGTGNGQFLPDKEISRQEMFTLLHNTLTSIKKLPAKGKGKKLTEFGDGRETAAWAREAVEFFAEKGIISGSGGGLKPMDTASRAEMVLVLYRLLSL